MRFFILGLVIGLAIFPGQRAIAGGVITVDNRSRFPIKVVAPGGSAVVEPDAQPRSIAFENDEPIGVTLRIWWVPKALQICQIFTPWDRTVTVSGQSQIICLSER